MSKSWIKITINCLILFCPIVAHAAPPGAIALPDNSIVQKSSAGKLYVCGNVPPWAVGRMTSGYFQPTTAEIASLKKKLKATSDSNKKNAIKAKIKSRKAYLNAGSPICSSNDSSEGNFDEMGNVTAAGKIAFGIPSNINANVNSGIAAWNGTCKGCHGGFPSSLPIKTYTYISQRITQSPMFFSVPAEVSFENIASIVAFANY